MKHQKKAQAGLQILISVIVAIFVIGLLTMIFALMGSGMINSDSLYVSATGTYENETLTTVPDDVGEDFLANTYRSPTCTITEILNSSNAVIIDSGNYSQTNCNVNSSGGHAFNNTNWDITYSYLYLEPTGAIETINETTTAIGGVTTWFPIMIVITAMVVLILLTVIIITAIRGSGLMGDNGKGNGGGNVGTA